MANKGKVLICGDGLELRDHLNEVVTFPGQVWGCNNFVFYTALFPNLKTVGIGDAAMYIHYHDSIDRNFFSRNCHKPVRVLVSRNQTGILKSLGYQDFQPFVHNSSIFTGLALVEQACYERFDEIVLLGHGLLKNDLRGCFDGMTPDNYDEVQAGIAKNFFHKLKLDWPAQKISFFKE